MATFLYRLGRLSFRRRRVFVALWIALLAATGVAAATLSEPVDNSFRIPGTESQRAIDQLTEKFPEAAAGGATARIVFAAPDGRTLTDPQVKNAVSDVVAELRRAPQVAHVVDPYAAGAVNPTGTVGYAQVSYQVQFGDMTDAARDALRHAAAHGRDTGLTVEVGGDAVQDPAQTGATEVIGVGVAALVLLVTFGSLAAAGLPLLTAIIGIGIGIAGITALTAVVDVSSNATALALMIGLAVAIDYALFIVSRYQHELAAGRDLGEAAGRAVGTAGSAVVFAGLTVIISLAGLSVVGIPFLTQMGLAAAGTVAIAVLIALTLLPALLGIAGRRVLGRRARDPEAGSAPNRPTVGLRWARLVTRRPVTALLAAVVGLGVIAIPASDLRLALPDDGVAGPQTTQRKAYDLLSAGFGPGFNGPLLAVVDTTGSADAQATARQVADMIAGMPNVAAVSPAAVNAAGDTALLQVIPASGPTDEATSGLVTALRGRDLGTEVAVTGHTALQKDVSDRLTGALPPYLLLVIGLAVLLLTLVFRSVLVPVKATLGFLLTVAATFGAVVAVFQWGWLAEVVGVDQVGPTPSVIPIFLVGIVFGLAMDYQVFLVTRMREEYVHGAPAGQAVVNGFQHGARVVTAAAVIMMAVFVGFVPSHDMFIKTMGFALAVGVLIDALVVRMTIVPATMTLLGRAAWWLPGWLNRLLPAVDVEGDQLHHRLNPATTDASNEREPELTRA
ncbi:MMPL family transporter [Micromonospora sp. WMMA1363]|uniref:MMPL family transporter n=1 Tax=Micromonospora sp. WMMA1363 TaxID=3053985 RepID=UPI00259CEEA3|nr:MMPL family transporter [Micromonospora sp. WMMA1363]MDM4718792.1 MMPL family transporter [Micromonospora sp. WMMA1363]